MKAKRLFADNRTEAGVISKITSDVKDRDTPVDIIAYVKDEAS